MNDLIKMTCHTSK